ncbi:expressed unknown protein [Seminavis robusta]|uniref:EGF-like domain-containing protein n=1 Tax=Seminavis robusta TaxID=568900 RepID=A0A9N8D6Z8_9STRA|nr:expressed unknown protein [Seminavis robusta]|eukprot:Sro21_g014990.1 n/a (698) ;mRNA; r:158737-161558
MDENEKDSHENNAGTGDGNEDKQEETWTTSLTAKIQESIQPILDPYAGDDSARTQTEDEDRKEHAMTSDIYSLMSIVPVFSVSFSFAGLVFAAQFILAALALVDLVDFSADPIETNGVRNPTSIPPDVSIEVKIAQFIGVLLISNFAAGQGDLFVGFTHLLYGYDSETIKEYPHATFTKWYLAGTCQFLVGILLTADLMVLMFRSTSVVELCLNFAALHFVQDIDDVAFTVASMGLITRRVRKDCDRVGNVMIHTKKKRQKDGVRRAFLLIFTISLYIPAIIVTSWQWSGRFMCQRLYIQFGDLHSHEWPYSSGFFEAESLNAGNRFNGRAVYVDRTQTMRLAYCGQLQAWAFSYIGDEDYCNYFIVSSTTTSFDVIEVAGSTWFALTKELGPVPMDWLYLSCSDCTEHICTPGHGQCEDNVCICNEGYLGLNCEFLEADVCPAMALDRRSDVHLSTVPNTLPFTRQNYTRVLEEGQSNQYYGRPLYVSTDSAGFVDLIVVFAGYRWIMYGLPQEVSAETAGTNLSHVATIFDRADRTRQVVNVTSDYQHFTPFLFSSPVQFGTESHEVDPINVQWFAAQLDESNTNVGAKADTNRPWGGSFICKVCSDNRYPCENGGICYGSGTDSYCNCTNPRSGLQSYAGTMCEHAFSCADFRARFNQTSLNGCECDSVYGVCTRCDFGFHGNLCQFKDDDTGY